MMAATQLKVGPICEISMATKIQRTAPAFRPRA
jgi:hypothetical protein